MRLVGSISTASSKHNIIIQVSKTVKNSSISPSISYQGYCKASTWWIYEQTKRVKEKTSNYKTVRGQLWITARLAKCGHNWHQLWSCPRVRSCVRWAKSSLLLYSTPPPITNCKNISTLIVSLCHHILQFHLSCFGIYNGTGKELWRALLLVSNHKFIDSMCHSHLEILRLHS